VNGYDLVAMQQQLQQANQVAAMQQQPRAIKAYTPRASTSSDRHVSQSRDTPVHIGKMYGVTILYCLVINTQLTVVTTAPVSNTRSKHQYR
jgi:hypothetical protein